MGAEVEVRGAKEDCFYFDVIRVSALWNEHISFEVQFKAQAGP